LLFLLIGARSRERIDGPTALSLTLSLSPTPPQVRHPNILQFRDTAEVEERGETVSERERAKRRQPLHSHLPLFFVFCFPPSRPSLSTFSPAGRPRPVRAGGEQAAPWPET